MVLHIKYTSHYDNSIVNYCLELFHSEFSGHTSLVTKDIGGLTLREQPQSITSAAADDSSIQTPSAILAEAFRRLGSIRNIYVRAIEDVCSKQKLKMSRLVLD